HITKLHLLNDRHGQLAPLLESRLQLSPEAPHVRRCQYPVYLCQDQMRGWLIKYRFYMPKILLAPAAYRESEAHRDKQDRELSLYPVSDRTDKEIGSMKNKPQLDHLNFDSV